MRNDYWSTYVQYPEELYRSRALRFRSGNKDLWLGAIGVRDGMRVLEVGCGSGIFCHRIKTCLPNTKVTGLDLDTGHIEYAKTKTAELGLDGAFVQGDATALPFEDGSFDLCFSYTVISFCEPEVFIGEQYRVLKSGGSINVMNVLSGGQGNTEMWAPEPGGRERVLFDRLWAAAEKNELGKIRRYNVTAKEYPKLLEKAGFKDIRVITFAVMSYNPDSSDISPKTAEEQINENRLTALCSVKKARALAPGALTGGEFDELIRLINVRYDRRIDQYRIGERLWDFETSTVIAVSGRK